MISARWLSSWGGRPTTVKGQMASAAVIDLLHLHHRKGMRQAVIAQVIAEGTLGQGARGIDGAGDAEVGVGGEQVPAAARIAEGAAPPACRRSATRACLRAAA